MEDNLKHPLDKPDKSISRVGRNTFLLASSDIAVKFLVFLFFIISARHLGVNQFGVFSFAIGFVTLFIVITDLGINLLITREVARDYSLIKSQSSNIFSLKIILSLITIFIVLGVIFISKYPLSTVLVVSIIAVSVIFNAEWLFLNAIFQALEKMYLIALSRFLYGILLVVGVLLLVFLKVHIIGYSMLYLGSIAVAFLVTYLIFYNKYSKIKLVFAFQSWSKILKQSIPFGLTAIFVTFYYWSGLTFLSAIKGNDAVGLYNASFRIALALTFIPNAFSNAVFPLMSRCYSEHQKDTLKKILHQIFKYMFLLALPMAILLTIYSEKIITLFYGNEFGPSGKSLKMLAWWIFFIYLNNILSTSLFAVDAPQEVTKQSAIATVINLLLNIILIPKFSTIGLGIALVVAEMFSFFYLIIQIIKRGYGSSRSEYLDLLYKSALAGIVLILSIFIFKNLFWLFTVVLSVVIYLSLLVVSRTLDKSDYLLLLQVIYSKK